MLFKILGGLLVVWGAADFLLSLQGTDLWGMVGVTLPDIIWSYSHYIAIGAGALLFSVGSSGAEEQDG